MSPEEAVARLEELYGTRFIPTVYFVQWNVEGPVKIGYSTSFLTRVETLQTTSPEPLIVRALVPGGQAHEHWFHRRHKDQHRRLEWYAPAGPVLEDAERYAELCVEANERLGDLRQAQCDAIRELDPILGDLERLYMSGVKIGEIARFAGVSSGTVRSWINSMRAMGFFLPYRRSYASRSPRFETPIPRGGVRHLG